MARKWKDVRAEKLTPEMAERVNQRVTQEIVLKSVNRTGSRQSTSASLPNK